MLQRIYVRCVEPNDKQAQGYLSAARGRPKSADHRRIGRELDLFHLQEERRGAVFWHPKGWALFQQLIAYMRARQTAAGFQEAILLKSLDRELWVKSGHIETSAKTCT